MFIENGAKITSRNLQSSLKGSRKVGDGDCKYSAIKKILEQVVKARYKSALDPAFEAAILGDSNQINKLIEAGKILKKDESNIVFFTCAFVNAKTLELLEKRGVNVKI